MQYKTIVLVLLQQQTPLYEQLRTSRQLLAMLENWATGLKTNHESWIETLSQTMPGSDSLQIRSEALELAIQELRDCLRPVSLPDEDEPISLDQAMAYLQLHKLPA